jgi:hypothetical protein
MAMGTDPELVVFWGCLRQVLKVQQPLRRGREEVWRILPPASRRLVSFSETRMMCAKQMKFCGALARALLIGVKFGELNGVRIGSGSKMGKLQ